MLKKIKKAMLILAAAGALWVASLVAFLWIEHKTGLVLPAPSGSFAVGRITETWSDDQRADSFVDAPPGSRTELVVWIWYPVTKTSDQKSDEYLPASWRRELALRGPFALLTRDNSAIHLRAMPIMIKWLPLVETADL